MDWVLPTSEILAKVEKLAEEERKARERQTGCRDYWQRQNSAHR